MADSGKNILEKVIQFKKLDKKRSLGGGLTEMEEDRWRHLKHEVSQKLCGVHDSFAQENTRNELRVPTSLVVSFHDENAFRKAYISNISGGGLYVETEELLALHSELDLEIGVSEWDRVLKVRGKVVWVNSNPQETMSLKRGVGVKFLELSKEATETIRLLVHQAIDTRMNEKSQPSDARNPKVESNAKAPH